MKKFLLLFIFLPLISLAQTSNVTATITDSDNQVWDSGTYTISFVPTPGNPGPYTQNGAAFNLGPFTGALSNSGVLTISLADNSTIQPSGSQWQYVICPNASSPCGNKNVATIGASPNLTAPLSASVPVVRFPAINTTYGYADAEVTPIPHPGGSYWNVTSNCLRQWNGSSWGCSTGTIIDLSSPPPIGDVTPNIVYTSPLVIDAGSTGDTTYRRMKEFIDNDGLFSWESLTSTNTPSDTTENFQWQFRPWFKPGPANQAGGNGMGVVRQAVPFEPFIMTGGQPWQGTLATFSMPDPSTACTVTHNGGGSTGVTYYLRYLDALQHYSNYISCTDASGYPTPDGTHINTISYVQSQGGADTYGGSYSDLLIARTNPSTGVLDLSGLGTISNLTACNNKLPSYCTYADDGSASTTTLATLTGLYYDYVEGNNTNDSVVQGRLFTLTRGANLYGGVNEAGQIRTSLIPTPSAPTITVNTTGSTTISYVILVNDNTVGTTYTDLSLGHTLPSADATVTNSAATANNTISWNITFECSSVTVLKHASGLYYRMPNSTILPCYGGNTEGGFGPENSASYTDTGSSYTLFAPDTRNTTADVLLDNTGSAGNGASLKALNGILEGYYIVGDYNVTSKLFVTGDGSGSTPNMQFNYSDGTHFPYIQFLDAAQVQQFVFGGDLTSSNILTIGARSGNKFNFTGGLRINGNDFLDTSNNASFATVDSVGNYKANGVNGFSGTKTAGSCVLTISGGIITNVTGC